MKQALACFMLLTLVPELAAQSTPSSPAQSTIRNQIALLEPGKTVTLILRNGKKVEGSVIGHNAESLELRVNRGFFRHRSESVPLSDIESFKKHGPAWVGPVVVLAVVGGVCVAVAACVASGACSR